MKRYGGRIPLMLGPLIVTAGFVLFAMVLGKGGYWKTYFPAMLVLGLGMAVVVAPLTTVVMNSVDQKHAGTASGINNAVARVAAVLANAVFGYVMLKVFDARLEHNLANLNISPNIIHEIQSREMELAALQPPQGLDAKTVMTIRGAISESFISGFRVVLLCCAALSMASALIARHFIAPNAPDPA